MQYWYWEHFGTPSPVLKNPELKFSPRILRWAPERLRRGSVAGQAEHSVVNFRLRLEEATWLTIQTNPYRATDEAFQHPWFAQQWTLSHNRFVLAGAGHFEWYLGERLHPYLQMGPDRFAIPHPPPQCMQLDEATFLRWVVANFLPVQAARVRGNCTLSDWVRYWHVASLGGRLDGRFHHVNTEYVNPAAAGHLDLLPRGFPSHAGPSRSGRVETSARPASLAEYYTPDLLQLGDGTSYTFLPHHVELPDYATSENWRDLCTHEKGLLMATRDRYAASSADYAETSRNLETVNADLAEAMRKLSMYTDTYGFDFEIEEGIPPAADEDEEDEEEEEDDDDDEATDIPPAADEDKNENDDDDDDDDEATDSE